MVDDEQPDLSAFDPDASDSGPEADESDETDEPDKTDDGGGSDPDHDPASERGTVAELDRDERVELGVDLLAHIEAESLSISSAVDRIETVTTNPALTREILDTAERRGIIERADGRLRTRRGGTFVRFERQVVRRKGDYECRRCGASLSTGYFVRFESGELGPFGPSCVRNVLGRD